MQVKLPDLSAALEQGLRAQEDSRDNSVLHVTDLAATIEGEGCPRQLWFRIHGHEKRELTPGMMLMFHHGKRIHQDLVPLIKAGLSTDWQIMGHEIEVEYDDVIGTFDIYFYNKIEKVFVIGDFKSMRGNGFKWLKEKYPDQAKPAHGLQVQTYLYIADRCRYVDADMGLVFYVDREGQNAFQQRPVPRNDFAVEEAILLAKSMIAEPEPPDILPPNIKTGKSTKTKGVPVYVSNPWNCDYCDYMDITCPGALSCDLRDMGVVGHFLYNEFKPTKDLPGNIINHVEGKLVLPF